MQYYLRYTNTLEYISLAIAWLISSTITASVFMPKFREMKFTSAYEVSYDMSIV